MPRLHLLELEDQPWLPAPLRDGATDFLEFTQNLGGPFKPVLPKLRAALEATSSPSVVDLCSGGAGPWPSLLRALHQDGLRVNVVLTDLHPNHAAYARAEAAGGGPLRGHPAPVDATHVPADLQGFRTLFNGFHHFRPEAARAILLDATRRRVGIGVFEAVHRSALQLCTIPFLAATSFLLTPFFRPFRWSRLFFTYVLPLIPGLILFDGLVSCLRVYSPQELSALVESLGDVGYDWDIGTLPSLGPLRVTYLLGVPRPAAGG